MGAKFNWKWCGKTDGNCAERVETDRCPHGSATLKSMRGDGSVASVTIGSCNYAYYAQYECAGK
jgi:hypothetical protein